MHTVVALWRSTHPGPTLVVTAVALGLAVSVGLEPLRVALLGASVLCGQVSIGLSNDAIDAPRDRAVGRTDKPLAAQGAPARLAWILAVAAGILAFLLSAWLGWELAFAHLVFLACGWAYNVRLKATVWSALCFVVGFGVFPSFAPLALADARPAPLWAAAAGAAFGLAIHFSNVLPDLEDDARTGVRGLPHRVGRRASAGVAFGALAAGALAVALGGSGSTAPALAAVPWIGLAAVVGVSAWGLVASLRRPSRLAFRLVMLAAALLAAQLMLTGGLAG